MTLKQINLVLLFTTFPIHYEWSMRQNQKPSDKILFLLRSFWWSRSSIPAEHFQSLVALSIELTRHCNFCQLFQLSSNTILSTIDKLTTFDKTYCFFSTLSFAGYPRFSETTLSLCGKLPGLIKQNKYSFSALFRHNPAWIFHL